MKSIFILILSISTACFGQSAAETKIPQMVVGNYVKPIDNLTLEAAVEMTKRMTKSAFSLNKKVSIAVLDASGNIILLTRGDGVGPHNTEAARRKAYTALSTKTSTLLLLRNAEASIDAKNLNTVTELLLLSGGVPVWFKGNVIGSVGIAGGGSPENDDLIAKAASIEEIGITTK
ncbi:GlcG/HbpS family heme-binding protein [Chryseobacterium sp. Leaf201]|uniref:GlcG/HbpS family heme-binding protein n=1 Tax=Chryseobacterium sp. Leaf201 TaxID=1735672 RepID=UPI0006F4329C|nr:heme-binding protein [Chryseobacterium sp. Leaf201]KQM56847.1 hypothetical protein ASE55_19315 [Chryseobacterium sp. Leaf201]